MKKYFYIILSLLIGLTSSFVLCSKVFAAKKLSSQVQSLDVLSNDGVSEIAGSILNPNDDEANVSLSKQLLLKIRKIGFKNLTLSLTSTLDSTKTYNIPNDALVIQRKVLNKKPGRYLEVSLFRLTTPSGVTISPSSLPTDTYKIRIQGKNLDATTNSFLYRTPILIAGTVDSDTTGFVTLKNLLGNQISERTVATNLNGTFINEVRANRVTPETRVRKYIKAQTTEEGLDTSPEIVEETSVCVVEAVTDKTQRAIVPLDPENNEDFTDSGVKINDITTVNATIAIEQAKEGNEETALETAKGIVEDLKSDEGDDEDFEGEEDFKCDIGNIGQFAHRCSDDETVLASIGKDFREFVLKAICNFPEFKLIKKIIPILPESANVFIGKGYCEISQEEDNDRPCEIYSEILRDFKKGLFDRLPCPPEHCNEFASIQPPKCFEPQRFCDDHRGGPGPRPFAQVCRGPNCRFDEHNDECFTRPMRDLYCAAIPNEVSEAECTGVNQESFGPREFQPNWTAVKNSKGNLYCVPSNMPKPQFPPGYNGPLPPSTKEEVAEECEVNACHRQCSEQYGIRPNFSPVSGSSFPPPPPPATLISGNLKGQFTPPPYTGPKENYSSEQPITGPYHPSDSQTFPSTQPYPEPYKCEECDCHRKCDAEAGRLIECNDRDQYFSKKCCERGPGQIFFAQSYPGQFSGGFGPGRGPIGINAFECLCKDTVNNFNEKGYVKPEAQKVCLESCPPGYEKGSNSDQCLPICDKEKGFVRDPGGTCRKKCPEGSFDDGTGYCRCPEGQSIGRSGKCESSPTCPNYCYNYPVFRKLLASHDFTGSTSSTYSPPYGGGSGYTPPTTGPGYIPPGTGPGYIPPGSTGSTNTLPPECQKCFGGPASCPPGQIYIEEAVVCVTAPCPPVKRCLCPDRSNPGPNGQCGQITTCSSNMYPNPNYVQGSNQAQCICPPGLPFWDSNPGSNTAAYGGQCVAVCSDGRKPYENQAGPANSPIPCNSGYSSCPPATPIKCADGRCAVTQLECNSSCPPATPHSCPDGRCVANSADCTSSCPLATPIKCADGSCKLTQIECTNTCPTSQPYKCPNGTCVISSTDCGTGSNYCSPAIIPTAANPCTCNPAGGSYFNSNGYCTCPTNSGPYTKETGCTSSTSRPCTAGEGPSNGCYCFGSGYTGSDGKCQCTGGIQYTGGGCGTSSTNYCSPGILPTAANPCTCNPAGGSYFNSIGYCICPSGSSTAYTVATGCGTSTASRPCTAGEGPSNGCYCFGSGYTGSDGKCQCTGGIQYTGGGCGTTTNYCAPAISTTTGCTCASGATPSGANGTCQCTNGQSYTSAGCGTSTAQCSAPFVTNPTGSPPCKCPDLTPIINGNTCVAACPLPLTSQAGSSGQQTCLCPAGKTLDTATNTCVCTSGQVSPPHDSSLCCPACTSGKVFNGIACGCACPSGQTEDANGQCVTPQTLTLSSAQISGSNLTINFIKGGFSECVLLVKGDDNSIILHNGVNAYANYCSGSGTVTYPLNNYNNITNGYSVKLCKGNGLTGPTNTGLYYPNLCSAPISVTSQ